MSIGQNIKSIRKERKYTQNELAKRANISRTYLSDIENDRYNPSIDTLLDIAKALEIEVISLIDSSNIVPVRIQPNSNQKTVTINVLGKIPAGTPIEAIEDIVDTEDIVIGESESVLDYFALKVEGNSMSPTIQDEDTVIIKKQNQVENGDVAAVLVNGYEATLKRIKLSDAGLTLIPDNTSYNPKFYNPEEVEKLPIVILGKVIEIRRTL